jgi:ATP-binding cassette, subfamily B, bacterial
MPLLELLPSEVTQTLDKLPPDLQKLTEPAAEFVPAPRIAFETDITQDGKFGTEWLVVENGQIYVLAKNGGGEAKMLRTVPLSAVKEVKTDSLVGSTQIYAKTQNETINLVRASNAAVSEANAVVRQIKALLKGESLPESYVEEKAKFCPKCGRALPEDSEVCKGCLDKRAVLVRLFRFLKPYKLQAAASVTLILALAAVELVPPIVAGRIVDTLTPFANPATVTPALKTSAFQTILFLVGMLALTRVLHSGFTYAQRRLNPWIGGRVTKDIRVALYHKYNEFSMSYYDKRSTGSLMSRVTNDADNLWDFLADGIPWFVSNLVTLIGIGWILFNINASLAFWMLIPAPCIYALSRWFMPRARRKYHHVWHRISKMYASLNASLTGMRVIKAFAQESKENIRFTERNQSVFEASYAANAYQAGFWSILSLLMSVGSFIIWIIGGGKVIDGVMTLGALTMFNGFLVQFYQPFQNFSRLMDWSTRSLTAAERVFEILDSESEVQEAKNAVPLPNMKGAVKFENVAFTYDKGKRALEDFSLEVEPGEMIGLVGHSGAGKSTLINLLSRFYDVTEGTIFVDGIDVRNIRREDFRRQLGIVLQEPFLFPGNIYTNIAYAKPDATPEEVIRAAKAANAHEFILKFPDGYDTQVGERGQRLSGGERQRISIARAILHDPKILILDEATASVDTETEKQIQEAIQRLIANRTTFAIAHRLSTLRHASRLVVMKDGKMVEIGTHDELMATDGEYAKLVNIQNEVNKIRAI